MECQCLLSKSEHICSSVVLVGDEGQARRRTEVGEAEWEATCDNANHISWLNHLVLSLGKFLLVFCLTVSLCTSCYELVKKIIITWLWEMVMKYTSLYSKGTRLLLSGRDRGSNAMKNIIKKQINQLLGASFQEV